MNAEDVREQIAESVNAAGESVAVPPGGVPGGRWEVEIVDGGKVLARRLAEGWEPMTPTGIPIEAGPGLGVDPSERRMVIRWLWPVRRLLIPRSAVVGAVQR